jgi:hypothetical protein
MIDWQQSSIGKIGAILTTHDDKIAMGSGGAGGRGVSFMIYWEINSLR